MSAEPSDLRPSRCTRLPGRALLLPSLLLAGIALCSAALGCAAEGTSFRGATSPLPTDVPEQLTVRVLGSGPHSPTSYTQGLVYEDGDFLESGGGYGRSFVRLWNAESGEVLVEEKLEDSLFAEGLAKVGDRLVQLTWRSGVALVRDAETLREVDRWSYEGEGWGLCYDGRDLWMSDGSATLQRRDARTFEPLGRIEVYGPRGSAANLNELECAEGWIYANVYQSREILQIDPGSGKVRAVIQTGELLTPTEAADAEVINGIAYDSSTESFFLTGKYWPRIFRVKFVPVED